MSDILIKNMKMPIGCDGWGTSCPLLQWGLGDVYCRITHRHFDSIEDCYKYAKERPADCPLMDVLDKKLSDDDVVTLTVVQQYLIETDDDIAKKLANDIDMILEKFLN